MHELSIAMGIVDIAEKEAKKINASAIEAIELEIGELSGVEIDALNFVWESAVNGSVLENATKKIDIIKGKAKCLDCNSTFDIKNIYDACPKCNSYLKGIIQGKELKIKTLEIS